MKRGGMKKEYTKRAAKGAPSAIPTTDQSGTKVNDISIITTAVSRAAFFASFWRTILF